MIAFKPYSLAPVDQRPLGVPLQVPWMMATIQESDYAKYKANRFSLMTDEQYAEFIASIQPQIDAWESTRSALQIEAAIAQAMAFGQTILITFRAENVALGVLQDNMTGWLLNKLSSVMDAILTGSLSEAIVRLKAIPTAEYDGKYMTVPRMIQFINKIEVYLGVPLTTELL